MPAGPLAVPLDIAGLQIALRTSGAAVADVVRSRYRGFLGDGADDWEIDVAAVPGPSGRSDAIVVERSDAGRVTAARHDFSATLDLPAHRGRVALTDVDAIAVDAFVRVTWSLALLDADGLLVHAASLARGERAWLFCGRSGSGKTTLARLATDARLLSDEISCVRLTADGPRAWGTPFWGDLERPGENRGIPLSALYFLEQADHHARERLAPARALERLLPTVLFFAKDPALTARAFAIAARLVKAVPCFRLAFRRDTGFWEVIDDA